MAVIAITGLLASGKTSVLKLCSSKKAAVFNSDSVIRGYYRDKTGDVFKKIAQAFPQAIYRGKISRKKLAAALYSDRKNKELLESIVHPAVIKDLLRWVKKVRRKNKFFFAEVPLLFEKDLARHFDYTVFVHGPREILVERVIKRYGISKQSARRRLGYFLPAGEKKRKADFIIKNDGEFKLLQKEVDLLWKKLKQKQKLINQKV